MSGKFGVQYSVLWVLFKKQDEYAVSQTHLNFKLAAVFCG
jgi:hypothetical protein